ncbi:nucleoid-associated protein [Streptococcus sp. DD12]|uniref:nucleoid-associated protein n=1 Tax=Streptococcus sp. DD12 TaxID=1777880 RepID=UPI0009ECAFD2
MDFYLKTLFIHQFRPDDTEIQWMEEPLAVTPALDSYFSKKLAKVFSDDAKRGQLEQDHPFWDYISDDNRGTSQALTQAWLEAFKVSENQKTNDLVFLRFEKDGQAYIAFLRMALKESLVHAGDSQKPLQLTQNVFPSAAQTPDEALVLNLETGRYFIIEKRIKSNGGFLNYFTEDFIQTQAQPSVKKAIKSIEQVAKKVADDFNRHDFQFDSKIKSAIHQNMEEEAVLSAENLANQLFEDNLTARLTFVDKLKDTVPDAVPINDIDSSRQLKKFENQKLSLSNGIELLVPNAVYEDADSVEFIQNPNGTYSILIKNIEDIQNK